MTDTELNVPEDEVDFSTEDEDDEIDFDNLFPPDGPTEVEVKSVLYQNYVRESDSKQIKAFRIQLNIVSDDEFSGYALSHYMYMGDTEFKPLSRKQFKGFCEAVGVPCEGKISMSDFQPTTAQIGNQTGKLLGVFSGLRCGAYLKTKKETGNDDVEREQTKPTYYMSLDKLQVVLTADAGPEPF